MTPEFILSLKSYGVVIVAANVLLDQIGLPVPAVPTLIVAGAIAADGHLPLPSLFAWSVIACLRPTAAGTWSARSTGSECSKTLCRISLEPDSCVSQTQSRFERWGVNSLVIAKFVPGLAIIAPPMAGAMRIGWPRFMLLSACSAVLWVGTGLAAGVLFKSQIARLLERLSDFGSAAGAGAVILLVALHRVQVVGTAPLLQDAAHGTDQRCRSL